MITRTVTTTKNEAYTAISTQATVLLSSKLHKFKHLLIPEHYIDNYTQ